MHQVRCRLGDGMAVIVLVAIDTGHRVPPSPINGGCRQRTGPVEWVAVQ